MEYDWTHMGAHCLKLPDGGFKWVFITCRAADLDEKLRQICEEEGARLATRKDAIESCQRLAGP